MRHSNRGSFRDQVNFLRRQFLQDGDLPFTDVLTEEVIAQALAAVTGWLDRIFSPLVTLWVFLGQVLSADHSCRAAVARLIAHRLARGQSPCSARDRRLLPGPQAPARVVLRRRRPPDGAGPGRRAWTRGGCGRAAASTSTTGRRSPCPTRRRTRPRTRSRSRQKPGLGFPLARIAAVFSLACGAILDLGICRYAGKGQSELGLLRTLWDLFRPGDVVLADRLMCAWTEMVMLKQRGVDCVCRFTLAPQGRLPPRQAPGPGRPRRRVAQAAQAAHRSTGEAYDALPDSLTVRECRVRVEQPGFRDQDPRRRHDAAGRRRVYQRRPGPALSGALARGDRPSGLPLKRQPVPRRRRRLESP